MAIIKKAKGCVMNVLLLVFTEIMCSITHTSAALVPGMIMFGDSTVDSGNNDYLDKAFFKANYPPYGRDYKNHEATGRFCNGKLVTDITGDTLGFSSYSPPYFSQWATGKNLLLGANFASAGSGYYEETSKLYQAISLSQQLDHFKEYKSKLSNISRSKVSSIVSGSLYIISTGTGDFIHNYYKYPHINKAQSPHQFSSFLVGIVANFIKNLYGLGARRIGITSLPPLGCLPGTIRFYGNGSNECIKRFNDDARDFNTKLNATAISLAKRLPNLKIVVFDIYTPLYELTTSPSKYGFFEARKACCRTGTIDATSVLCKRESRWTCSNSTGYVFWDDVHPSESANQVLADSIMTQGISLVF